MTHFSRSVAFALILSCAGCVAVPYDAGPGPGPYSGGYAYSGDYPYGVYPWSTGVNIDVGNGWGHGYGGRGYGGYGGFHGGYGGHGGGGRR